MLVVQSICVSNGYMQEFSYISIKHDVSLCGVCLVNYIKWDGTGMLP